MFTRRELEVIRLLIEDGASNKEIAKKMCVNIKTVQGYVTSIHNKLKINSSKKLIVAYYKGELKDYFD